MSIKPKNQLAPSILILLCKSTAVVVLFALTIQVLLGLSYAAGNAGLAFSPATGSYDQNSNFTLGVYEDSGDEDVNGIDIELTYDQSKLQFVGVNTTASAFKDFCSSDTGGGNGKVKITCVKLGGSVKNKQLAAEVTFKALAGSGSTLVNFGQNSHILRSSDSQDIWNGDTTGSNYSFTTPSSANTGSSPSPSPTPTGVNESTIANMQTAPSKNTTQSPQQLANQTTPQPTPIPPDHSGSPSEIATNMNTLGEDVVNNKQGNKDTSKILLAVGVAASVGVLGAFIHTVRSRVSSLPRIGKSPVTQEDTLGKLGQNSEEISDLPKPGQTFDPK